MASLDYGFSATEMPVGGTLRSGLYGEAPPRKGCLFYARSMFKGRKKCHFSNKRFTQSASKWTKWWLKRKGAKGCHILVEITTH